MADIFTEPWQRSAGPWPPAAPGLASAGQHIQHPSQSLPVTRASPVGGQDTAGHGRPCQARALAVPESGFLHISHGRRTTDPGQSGDQSRLTSTVSLYKFQ